MVKNTYHHGNLKKAIINEAFNLLESKNYEELSFRLISRNIGVVSSAPYNHFKNKNHLLQEIILVGGDKLLKKMKDEKEKSKIPSEQLFFVAKAYLNYATKNKALFRLMFGKANKELLYFTSKIVLQFEEIISEKYKTGKRVKLTVKGSAITAWSMVHGLAVMINNSEVNILENIWKIKVEKLFKEMSAIWGKGVTYR